MLQTGHADTALVYGFGKSSLRHPPRGPDHAARPLLPGAAGIDCVAIAALQARGLLERSDYTERDMAEVAPALAGPRCTTRTPRSAGRDATQLLAEPYWVVPLRKHDCPPITDGAAAVVLVAGDGARTAASGRPGSAASTTGSSRIASASATSRRRRPPSAAVRRSAPAGGSRSPSCTRPSRHQELILRDALALAASATINPSGGPLAANPLMAAGLSGSARRSGRSSRRRHRRALAHATRSLPAAEPRLRPGG